MAPDAPRTLTIKIIQQPRLLKLPRELRDIVYRFTLVEPTKWDKRHVIGCSYYNPQDLSEKTPYRVCSYEKDVPANPESAMQHNQHVRSCYDTCMKRRGLCLLRVSKQTYKEASPIFWNSNMFCFDHAGIFVAIFSTTPQAVLNKIRKLSLIMTPRAPSISPLMFSISRTILYKESKAVNERLSTMENLIHLELSTEWAGILRFRYTGFRSLRHIHCLAMEKLTYVNSDGHGSVDVGLRMRINVPVCLPQLYVRCGGDPEQHYCGFCCEFFEEAERSLTALESALTRKGQLWKHEVQRKIQLRQPCQTAHKPYILPLTLSDGALKEVDIWGLPVRDADGRAKDRRKVGREAHRAKQTPTTQHSTPAPRMLVDDEEGEVPIPNTRRRRHWRWREEQSIKELEQAVQRRKEAREEEARNEDARKSSARKMAAEALRKANCEAQAERKAARKRVGRRKVAS